MFADVIKALPYQPWVGLHSTTGATVTHVDTKWWWSPWLPAKSKATRKAENRLSPKSAALSAPWFWNFASKSLTELISTDLNHPAIGNWPSALMQWAPEKYLLCASALSPAHCNAQVTTLLDKEGSAWSNKWKIIFRSCCWKLHQRKPFHYHRTQWKI